MDGTGRVAACRACLDGRPPCDTRRRRRQARRAALEVATVGTLKPGGLWQGIRPDRSRIEDAASREKNQTAIASGRTLAFEQGPHVLRSRSSQMLRLSLPRAHRHWRSRSVAAASRRSLPRPGMRRSVQPCDGGAARAGLGWWLMGSNRHRWRQDRERMPPLPHPPSFLDPAGLGHGGAQRVPLAKAKVARARAKAVRSVPSAAGQAALK